MAQEFRPSEPLLQGIRELFEENPHGSNDHQAPFTLSTPRGWARSVELPQMVEAQVASIRGFTSGDAHDLQTSVTSLTQLRGTRET